MTSVIRSEVVERTTNIHKEEKLFIVKIRRGRSKNTLLQVKVQIYYQLNVLKVTKVKKQPLLWQQIVVLELIG